MSLDTAIQPPTADRPLADLTAALSLEEKVRLVVGDTPYDVEAAAKVNLTTVGLLCGGWQETELRQAGCVVVYRDPADLLDHYAESPLS